MDRNHIGSFDQFVLGHTEDIMRRCALLRQILAPGNHAHAEDASDLRDRDPHVA